MSDYMMNGTVYIRKFMRDNGIDENRIERIAAAVNVPRIHFANRNGGQTPANFTRRISEAQAQSLADMLSTTVGTLTNAANGPILITLP